MTKSGRDMQPRNGVIGSPPSLNMSKLGIVSRNYLCTYGNGYRDFSHTLADVLKLLDEKGCDAVLYSLFSVVPRQGYNPHACFEGLDNINVVFLEEFEDGPQRCVQRYVIHHRTPERWVEYELQQQFGTITGMLQKDIANFVDNEIPKRVAGDCCVLLCGESNGVKYSPNDKKVHDTFKLRRAIPKEVNIILNPVHDRMIRFEMKLKRQFLSEDGRWVISVWNKGKKDRNGNSRDGQGPAWTVFHNGAQTEVELIPNQLGVEIGILDFRNA